MTLFWPDRPGDTLTVRGARVVDVAAEIDGAFDVAVEDGVITSIERAGEPAPGLVLAPAFVDPHVHLRVPGREDEETIATGTAAAAAGGYCAILAMPNTDPVVDSAAVLGALIEQARADAVIPTGFMASISKGLRGEELTEMVELARLGAAAFTDDGHPVVSSGLMQRALQYSGAARRILSLHEEDPSLSRDGQMNEGSVSAALGLAGWPSIAESVMIERDCSIAAYLQRPLHIMHLSARESVAAVRAAQARGVRVTAEVSPHHLCLTDETVRTLDTNRKMNPPLRAEDDRQALLEGLRDGTIGSIATDHAPHARHEKETPFEEAPFGVTGLETAFAALNTFLVETGELELELVLERMSTGPARVFGLPVPRIAVGERANLVLLDLDARWLVTEDRLRSRSTNSWLLRETLTGSIVKTIADGRVVHAP
ncbi:dihydroorotase [Gaiella sp.]|uniref:dihydroorotase n=1 Tax=Gaiella sp. TaxID=2663207 RepID=UPI0032636FD2